MEKKAGAVTGVQRKAADLLKALLCAYIITGILLLVLALLLYKLGMSEGNL